MYVRESFHSLAVETPNTEVIREEGAQRSLQNLNSVYTASTILLLAPSANMLQEGLARR